MRDIALKYILFALGFAGLLASTANFVMAAPTKSWTADNGNGTYSSPLFYE